MPDLLGTQNCSFPHAQAHVSSDNSILSGLLIKQAAMCMDNNQHNDVNSIYTTQ